MPRSFSLTRVSLAGRLEGLSNARPGRNLQIKLYVPAGGVRALGASEYAPPARGVIVKFSQMFPF